MKIIPCLLSSVLALVAVSAGAQTNFEGFSVGQAVSIESPTVALGHATIQNISSNSITVLSQGEKMTFATTNIMSLKEALKAPAAAVKPSAPSSAFMSNSPVSSAYFPNSNLVGGLDPGAAILSQFSSDPNYSKAMTYYQQTMAGVRAGTVSLQDLRNQAAAVLQQMDQYGPERKKDPAFEPYVAQLQDFIKRVDSGEAIVTAPVQ